MYIYLPGEREIFWRVQKSEANKSLAWDENYLNRGKGRSLAHNHHSGLVCSCPVLYSRVLLYCHTIEHNTYIKLFKITWVQFKYSGFKWTPIWIKIKQQEQDTKKQLTSCENWKEGKVRQWKNLYMYVCANKMSIL